MEPDKKQDYRAVLTKLKLLVYIPSSLVASLHLHPNKSQTNNSMKGPKRNAKKALDGGKLIKLLKANQT